MRGISFAGVALALLLNGNPAEAATLRVADFGARGDGRSDDTAALQRALNAVNSGDELHFEAGRTYVISQSLSIRHKSGYTVEGNGATIRASSALPAHNTKNSYIIYISENRNYVWRNLTFDGNKNGRSGPAPESGHQGWLHNIIIEGGSDFVFDRVRSNHSYGDGFYVGARNHKDTNSFPRRGTFLNCQAERNWRNGLAIINGYDMKVIGGSYSYTEGDWPMSGIQIEPNHGSAEPGVRGVSLERVLLWGNKGNGIGIASKGRARDITVDYSYLGDNARGGAGISGGNVTIQNSVFEWYYRAITYRAYGGTLGTETRGTVDLGAASGNNYNVLILNNIFREIHVGPSAVYIHSLAGQGAQVRGNCFERLGVKDIIAGSAANAMISNNTNVRCPSNRDHIGW